MKRILLILITAVLCFATTGCTKNDPEQFSLIGEWNIVSIINVSSYGIVERYQEVSTNYYRIKFEPDGYFIKTAEPNQISPGIYSPGIYIYNDATNTLQYKYGTDKDYINATVNRISNKEITITSYFNTKEIKIRHLKKL